MIVDEIKRIELFNQARNIAPNLGGLFQNPMKITYEDLRNEAFDLGVHLEEIRLYKLELEALERKLLRNATA